MNSKQEEAIEFDFDDEGTFEAKMTAVEIRGAIKYLHIMAEALDEVAETTTRELKKLSVNEVRAMLIFNADLMKGALDAKSKQ